MRRIGLEESTWQMGWLRVTEPGNASEALQGPLGNSEAF